MVLCPQITPNFNVTALVSASGAVVERYVYDAYGTVTVLNPDWSPRTANTSAFANEILFTGHPLDGETGLYYARLRYLQPTLGVWVNPDPSGYTDGMNLYQYCSSNPTATTDPSGLGGDPSSGTIVLPNGKSINHPGLAAFLAGFSGSERAELLRQVQEAAENPLTALGSELRWQESAQRLIDELIAERQRGPAPALREAAGPAAGFSPASRSWSEITSWVADRALHATLPVTQTLPLATFWI